MRLSEIERKAKSMGINDTWRYSKREIVRGIQRKEGNIECFSTRTRSVCGQLSCCFRSDCT